jgi:glycosyltransferase involved in cell wall biosynthesis
MSKITKSLSIVTVVFNDLKGLKETYTSLKAQTFTNFEWIVIDGASTDGTKEYIGQNNDLISKYISEPDNGIFDAMNKGIKLATGTWITFLNAGDTYSRFSILEHIFTQNLSAKKFIYSDMFLLDHLGKKVRYLKAETLTKTTITKGMIACHQGMFVRLNICPNYNSKFKCQGDLNWVMDIFENLDKSEILYLNIDSVYYKSGGFSDNQLLNQLKTHINLIVSRYGFWMLIFRLPRLLRRYGGKYLRQTLGIQTFRFWIKN